MKNVTITMDEEVAAWTRIAAARREQSVSRFVGEVLGEQMARDRAYEQAMRAFLSVRPSAGTGGEGLPSREEIHDRARVRR